MARLSQVEIDNLKPAATESGMSDAQKAAFSKLQNPTDQKAAEVTVFPGS
ncbi:MAG: hypothetical protein ACRC80_08650 [Waterburya sp.]